MSFVRRKDERPYFLKNMFGGEGELKMNPIVNGADELYGKGRLFNQVVVDPGCSLGWHIHKGDGEIFLILKGEGEYNDNGTVVTVGPGDVTFVGDGEGHAMKNNGTEPMEMIALVVYS